MLKIRVYEMREARGMTLRRLSELSGVSYQEINKIENGISIPRLDTLYYIAVGLNCRISNLYSSERK